ncbi:MAG: hypothetical protein C4297_14990 [Gemmataceae bacterium]
MPLVKPAVIGSLLITRLRGSTILRSTIAKNAASLYVIQFANYIIPIITISYLVRVLGPTSYGVVAFAQSLINYFMVFVDYGFNLSTTRSISVQRDDLNAISRVVFNTWVAKVTLSVLGLVGLGLLIFCVPFIAELSLLMLTLYGIVIGNVLMPVWLFQGMERMETIALINLGSRILATIAMLLMIHKPEDYLLYAALLSGSALASGLVGAFLGIRMFKLRPVRPSWSGIWAALREGWLLFIGTVSGNVYVTGNAFVLGMLTNHTVVGYYSAAERVVRGLSGLLGPVSQAAFPSASKMAATSRVGALRQVRSILMLMSAVGLVLSGLLFFGASTLVHVLLGPAYEPSVAVVRVLAPLPALISISTVFGLQVILPFRKDLVFTSILVTAALLDLAAALLLVPSFGESGMGLALLLTEIFVTSATGLACLHYGLNPVVRRRADYLSSEEITNASRL